MSIRQIDIKNFQNHSDTTLKLDPGVNIVQGQSDSGKTAILRALRWLATNRPSGKSFESWNGKGETEVIVTLENGTEISHRPGQYFLTKPKDKKPNEWSAVGTTVPEAVAQTLNLSELNWQLQMDAPFLLSASPGEVARVLNEVADLDKIDSSLFNINRMIRENKAALLSKGQESLRLESELNQYANVDDLLKQIKRLKEMDRKAGLIEEMVGRGEETIENIASLQKTLSQFKDVESAEEMINGLVDLIGKEQEFEKQIHDIANVLQTLELKTRLLNDATEKITKLEKRWHDSFPATCPLCGK